MGKRTILLIFLLIVGFSLVSANGIKVIPNNVTISKINNQDKNISLTIISEEPFTFYNITSNKPFFKIEPTTLLAGENKTITATITSNDPFSGEVRIRGDYITNIGQQNITEKVIIGESGLSPCNLDLVIGDRLFWNNTLFSEVKLKNLDSGETFATITGKNTYEEQFNTPLEFNYQMFRAGIPFGDTCKVNVIGTSGFVHSQSLDALFNLNLTIDFEPTNISLIFLSSSYTLSYNQEVEDIFAIKNVGSKVAKNIRLSGEWVVFDSNNFDLAVGESKNIGYKIRPLVSSTSDTNKTYTLNISAEGNFEKRTNPLSVFVNYYDINRIGNSSSVDLDSLEEFVRLFCSNNPDRCPYVVLNQSNLQRNITLTTTEDAWIESQEEEARFREQMLSTSSEQSSKLENITEKVASQESKLSEKDSKIEELKSSFSVLTYVIWSLVSIILVFSCFAVLKYAWDKGLLSNKLTKYLGDGERW